MIDYIKFILNTFHYKDILELLSTKLKGFEFDSEKKEIICAIKINEEIGYVKIHISSISEEEAASIQ